MWRLVCGLSPAPPLGECQLCPQGGGHCSWPPCNAPACRASWLPGSQAGLAGVRDSTKEMQAQSKAGLVRLQLKGILQPSAALSVLTPPCVFRSSGKDLGKPGLVAVSPRQNGSWGPLLQSCL